MKPWRWWVSLFDARESGIPLALVRVLIALTVFHTIWDTMDADLVSLLWHSKDDGGYRRISSAHWVWDYISTGPTPEFVNRLCWFLMLGSGALAFGLVPGPVLPAVLLVALTILFSLNSQTGGGHDRVITNILFVLVFSGHSRALSVWSVLRHRSLVPAVDVAKWPRWLLMYQLAVIYCSTGLQKVGFEWMPWGDLTALYYSLQLPHWNRAVHEWSTAGIGFRVTQLGTLVTWFFEVFAPLWLVGMWARENVAKTGWLARLFRAARVRELFIVTGIALHFGIWITMNVGPFSAAMLSIYPCAVSGREWRSIFHKR